MTSTPHPSSPKGLLLVTMEPPASLEDEFNDWYDSEHFPQRRALPGVDSASRWVCVDGWPRYLALYDLASPTVLDSDAYRAVSGANATPWSKRVLPRTLGRTRVVAAQIAPGDAPTPSSRDVSRLAMARFRIAAADRAGFIAAWTAATAGLHGLRQARLFQANADPADLWTIAAFGVSVALGPLRPALGEVDGIGADILNFYAPYWRG